VRQKKTAEGFVKLYFYALGRKSSPSALNHFYHYMICSLIRNVKNQLCMLQTFWVVWTSRLFFSFDKLWQASIMLKIAVYLPAWKNSAPTRRNFMKFDGHSSKICEENSCFTNIQQE